MTRTLKLTLLTATLGLMLTACGGKASTQTEANTKQAPANPESAAKKAEIAPEKKVEEPKKENMKEKVAKAYTTLHCEGATGSVGKDSSTYKKLGFKSPKHFMKLWKRYASKDSDWAHEVAMLAEKTECKK